MKFKITITFVVVLALIVVLLVGVGRDVSNLTGDIVGKSPEASQLDMKNLQERVINGIKICSHEELVDGNWKAVVENC